MCMATIEDQIVDVMNKYEIEYSDYGVDSNLDEWENNKAGLVDILRKSPSWIESEHAIVFDVEESRGLDFRNIVTNCCDLENIAFNVLDNAYELSIFRLQLGILTSRSNQFLEKHQAQQMADIGKIKCAAGQKLSRVINRLAIKYGLDKHAEYNRVFAKLADSLNPLTVQKKAVLSVHPCDFLEMSNIDNSWSSCHNLHNGCYQAGTLSYMNDSTSMIFYTVSDDVMENFHKQPKITRQVFCFENGKLLQSRLYPNYEDVEKSAQYRALVQATIAECLEMPNLWVLKKDDCNNHFQTDMHALHYPDYEYSHFNITVSRLKAIAECDGKIPIGNDAYCLNCGDSIEKADSVICDSCAKSCTCAHCGTSLGDLEGYWVNDDFYCEDCTSFCGRCGETILATNATTVYDSSGQFWRSIEVCDHCRDDHYYCCEECGDYHTLENIVMAYDSYYCASCADSLLVQCHECGEMIHNDESHMISDHAYCESCMEKHTGAQNEKVQRCM